MTATIARPTAAPVTPRWYTLRPHPKQSAAWRSQSRFVCLPCGRQSGKTELAKRRLVRYLPVDRGHGQTHRYAFLAPTHRQGKRIAWDDLKALTPREWMLGLPRESELIIRCGFGQHISELHVIGMDLPARLEGPAWDGIVSDESSDQRPKLELSVRPAIDSRNGWWWMIGTPKRQGVGAQQYRMFCERGLAGEQDWATYAWPSWDIMPAETIEAARRDMDIKDFNEQYGAVWESIGGAAFYAFDADIHVTPCHHDPTRPILVGCDFNVSPMAWVLCHKSRDGRGLEVFDEIWLNDTNTQRTLGVLWDRYGERHKGGWIFHGDPTARGRHTSASASDYAQIKNDKRFKAKVLYSSGSPGRKDRASSCNAILRNAAGEVRCWIDERCTHLLADLAHRGVDADGAPTPGKPGGPYGHISDAWGYLVHWYWPSTRLVPDAAPSIGVYFGDK
jgi:hypothetical protein